MKVLDNVKAKGNYVVLKGTKNEKSSKTIEKKGILLLDGATDKSNPQQAVAEKEISWDFKVHSVGENVDSKSGLEIGEIVFYNNYDAKFIGYHDSNMFVLVKDSSIMATYSSSEMTEDEAEEFFKK